MAGISAIQRILDNQLTSKFARTLKHSDLPEGWADNPEIVALAEDAYREAGTESPFFKAWYGNSKMIDAAGDPLKVYHGTPTKNVENWAFDPDRVGTHGLSEGTGFYTATNPSVASQYAPNGGAVLEMFSNMQKPIELDQTKGLTLSQVKKIIKESITNEARQMAKDDGVKYTPDLLRDTWISNYAYTYDRPISSSIEEVAQGILQNSDTVLERIEDMAHGASDWQNIMRATQKHAGYDGVHSYGYKGTSGETADMAGDIYVHWLPESLKSTSNRGTFNPADPNIYKGLIPAIGAGGLLALLDADEAEAAVRPDIEDVIGKAIDGQAWAGRKAGSLESSVAKDALGGSAKYNGGDGYFTEHGLTWRNEANGWTPAQIAEGYRGIYDSPDTVVVPNVLGVNPSAKEALWNPNGKDSRSWYMPIAPYKKGFKGVTLYDPEASQVERLLKDRGYWEGGSTSSIFTPTLGERSKSIGSGTLSAVNSPSFENTIRGLEDWSKRNLPKVTGAATGAAIPLLTPEEVAAEKERYALLEQQQALGSPIVDPVDILAAPIGVAGTGAKAAAMAAEPFVSYGMDKLIGGILSLFDEEE